MRDLDKNGMESFDALDSQEKTIAILGNRWWPQTAKQDGDKMCRRFLCSVWKKRNEYLNAGRVSLFGVGTVLRLERDERSMGKRRRQAKHEYAPPPPSSLQLLHVGNVRVHVYRSAQV